MRRSFRYTIMTAFAVLCFAMSAFGQRTTGDIQGTVTDANGAVVPSVSVTVTGVSVGFNRTVQSDSQGAYRVQQVPAGTYKITTAAISGFASSTVEDIEVTIENVTVTNLKLGVTSVNTVDVSDETIGIIQPGESKVQTNITAKLIDQLPKGTSFSSLLRISPATRPEPLAAGFQVDGASGSENTFIVDGLPVENFRTGVLNGVNNIPTALVAEACIKPAASVHPEPGSNSPSYILYLLITFRLSQKHS